MQFCVGQKAKAGKKYGALAVCHRLSSVEGHANVKGGKVEVVLVMGLRGGYGGI